MHMPIANAIKKIHATTRKCARSKIRKRVKNLNSKQTINQVLILLAQIKAESFQTKKLYNNLIKSL